jgi:hypothetical protein
VRRVVIALAAAGLVVVSCVHVWSAARDPVRWTPDALYYEARMLELRGTGHDQALRETFTGPISAKLRASDPQKTGNAKWVKYNEPFYERRVAVPLAGAALYPAAGKRSLLYLSLAGYVAAVLALFGLLLLRFRLEIAAAVSAATIFLPPLVHHSSFPLTDSWGLALEIGAFAFALLAFERGRRWLVPWVLTIALLSFVRDTTWIPIAAVAWCALRQRSRISLELLVSGLLAAVPALLLFTAPVRDLLALLVNQSQVPSDTSWSFIIRHYPHAVVELVRANVGFLRRGEWYTAFYLVGGVAALALFARKRRGEGAWPSLLTAGAVAALGYVLAAPVFSAFRLELVFVPMAAFGLALATDRAAALVGERMPALGRIPARAPARPRRP